MASERSLLIRAINIDLALVMGRSAALARALHRPLKQAARTPDAS